MNRQTSKFAPRLRITLVSFHILFCRAIKSELAFVDLLSSLLVADLDCWAQETNWSESRNSAKCLMNSFKNCSAYGARVFCWRECGSKSKYQKSIFCAVFAVLCYFGHVCVSVVFTDILVIHWFNETFAPNFFWIWTVASRCSGCTTENSHLSRVRKETLEHFSFFLPIWMNVRVNLIKFHTAPCTVLGGEIKTSWKVIVLCSHSSGRLFDLVILHRAIQLWQLKFDGWRSFSNLQQKSNLQKNSLPEQIQLINLSCSCW